MKRKTGPHVHLIIFLMLFVIIFPGILTAATERRIALVIGNSTYSSGPLKNPVNDAADMAAMLLKLGFSVTQKQDASLQEMVETIEDFGNNLKRGGVGLFYYAGHGAQVNNVNYLLPINVRINKESDVRFQAVDVGRVLAEMENANNGLNIVILDACRDNPFGKSFRSAARGLAVVANAPTGTFISYSTGAGQVARDGEGRNSPYTKALLENIAKPELTINDVFMNVRTKVKRETGQVPWELSSLEGRFYFTRQGSDAPSYTAKSAPQPDPDELEQRKAALERERQDLARTKQELERQKALDAEREHLAAERRKIEAEKQQMEALKRDQAKPSRPPVSEAKEVAMGPRPSGSAANEIRRDGRFIAYDNGTVIDTETNLMWAEKDNGHDIPWGSAKNYCENYRGGGHTGWRMPTGDEMQVLFNSKTPLIKLGGNKYVWIAETSGSAAAFFSFIVGGWNWNWNIVSSLPRALPVRSVK